MQRKIFPIGLKNNNLPVCPSSQPKCDAINTNDAIIHIRLLMLPNRFYCNYLTIFRCQSGFRRWACWWIHMAVIPLLSLRHVQPIKLHTRILIQLVMTLLEQRINKLMTASFLYSLGVLSALRCGHSSLNDPAKFYFADCRTLDSGLAVHLYIPPPVHISHSSGH